jgi:hypothetical protein
MADSQIASAADRNRVGASVSGRTVADAAQDEAGSSFTDHREDAMMTAATAAYAVEMMADERRADQIRAAQQHRRAKAARQRREGAARRTRLIRFVLAPTR